MSASPPIEPIYQSIGKASPSIRRLSEDIKPLTPSRSDAHRASRTLSDTPSIREDLPRVSNVRVLNTSLPHVHDELVAAREKAKERGEDPDLILHPAQPPEGPTDEVGPTVPEISYDANRRPIPRPIQEQEATSRALKPHSRSVTALHDLRHTRPEAMTTMKSDDKKPAPVKVKPKKWQFGIRSRNAPYEAMKCIFVALKTLGADWAIVPALATDRDTNDDKDNTSSPASEFNDGEPQTILQSKYPHLPIDYYIPRNPWYIQARILKKGLLMPGEAPALSAHSSAVSLPAEAQHQVKKHLEELGGYTDEDVARVLGLNTGSRLGKTKSRSSGLAPAKLGENGGDAQAGQEAFAGPGQILKRGDGGVVLPTKVPSDQIGAWVFIDIQLYSLDSSTFVVDFKCDGYQNVVLVDPNKDRHKASSHNDSTHASPISSGPSSRFEGGLQNGVLDPEIEQEADGQKPYWKPTTKRYKNKEKEICSPFPYLDVASDLIACLAS